MDTDEAEMIAWLRGKLAEAEKAVRGREQGEAIWRSGTNESWAKVARATGEKALNKKERIATAERQARIAEKCRHEVRMIRAVIGFHLTHTT